jgi:hypothetical protein
MDAMLTKSGEITKNPAWPNRSIYSCKIQVPTDSGDR